MNLLEEYFKKFGEYPPKLMTVSYNNKIYQQLMKDAIEDDLIITKEDVEEAFEDIQYDVVQD